MKITLISFCSLLLFVGGMLYWNTENQFSDPLSAIIKEGDEGLKSDYITDEVFLYTGPISSTLQSCINASHASANSGKVITEYKGDPLLQILSRQQILNEISPVLKYAVNNSQINWTWNPDTRIYEFLVYPGQEPLWYCYFKNETNFFKYFLNPNTLFYQTANTPTPTSTPTPTFTSPPFPTVLPSTPPSPKTANYSTSLNEFITHWYDSYLLREADSGGLKYFSDQLRNGQTCKQVATNYLSSVNYQSESGNISHEEFLTRFYNGFLQRTPDVDGYTYWLNSLNSGASRADVSSALLDSIEFTQLCSHVSTPLIESAKESCHTYFGSTGFFHMGGQQDGSSWFITVQNPNTQLAYGPYTKLESNKTYSAKFSLKVDNNTADNAQIAWIDVYNATKDQRLAFRNLYRKDWNASQVYQDFELQFQTTTANTNDVFEFRVWYYGNSYLSFDKISLCSIDTAQSSVLYSCPGLASARNNDTVDASPLLKQCVGDANGKTVTVPPGKYWLKTQFAPNVKNIAIKTEGKTPSDPPCLIDDYSCAQFITHSSKPSTITPDNTQNNCDYFLVDSVVDKSIVLDHLIFDGNGLNRPHTINAGFNPDNRMPLFVLNNFTKGHISNSVFKNAGSGTAMSLIDSKNFIIENNIVANNGQHDKTGGWWSDGITANKLDHSIIRNNSFIDNSDIQLIFGGGKGTIAENNRFLHSGNVIGASYAEVMYHTWSGQNDGDYSNAAFKNNLIDCNGQCGIGIYVGGDLWYDNSDGNNLTIEGNTVKNAPSSLFIDEGSNTYVKNNTFENTGNKVVRTPGGPKIMRNIILSPNSAENTFFNILPQWTASFDFPLAQSIPNLIVNTPEKCTDSTCEAVNLYEFVLGRTPTENDKISLANSINTNGFLVHFSTMLTSDEFKTKFGIQAQNNVNQIQFLLEYFLLQNAKAFDAATLLSQYPNYTDFISYLVTTSAFKNATQSLFPDICSGSDCNFSMPEKVYQILSTGQSLGDGYRSTPAISNTQPYKNIMLTEDPTASHDNIYWNGGPKGLLAPLIPLVETYKCDTSQNHETPGSGVANSLTGYTNNVFALGMHGAGSQPYSSIKKGGTGEFYAYGQLQASRTKSLVEAQGKEYIPLAVTLIHGEHDAGRAQAYKSDISQMQQDYQADLNILTGKNNIIPLFYSQMNSYFADQMPVAQYQAQKEFPNIYLIGPTYQIERDVDVLHLSNKGSRYLGELFAKAMNQHLFKNIPWKPLMPIEWNRQGNEVFIKFHVPVKPLVIDTTLMAERTNPALGLNKGFQFLDNGNYIKIMNVEIVGDDTVKLTLASTPTSTNQVVRYAARGDNYQEHRGNPLDPNANGGNLRDSDSSVSPAIDSTRLPLYNWAVTFAENL